jgi:hypothetical protein
MNKQITKEVVDTVNKLLKDKDYQNARGAARKYIEQYFGVKSTQAKIKLNDIINNYIESDSVSYTGDANDLQEVLKATNVDLTKWEVENYTISKKEIKKEDEEGNINYKPKFEFNIKLRKKKIDIIEEINALKNDFKTYHPKTYKGKTSKDNGGEILLEVAIFDTHFGKLGWDASCGENYDMKIARDRYLNKLHSIVERAKKQGKINKILFPIGQDYLNIDNDFGTTTLSTPQQNDGRFPKIFREGRKILIEAIDLLKEIAPVDVLVVGGNHERNSMFHLGDALECWYHSDKSVIIDNRPISRKYYRYGNTLIAFSHGDTEKTADLPLLAAVESKDWSSCQYKEWHIGHKHAEHTTEKMGIKTRVLGSISGPDDWHFTNGYVGNIKSAQSFLFHNKNGLISIYYDNTNE